MRGLLNRSDILVSEPERLQIVLTPEQREQIRRVSGQVVDAIELVPDDTGEKGAGGPLRFLWRISAASGIPRQRWAPDGPQSPPKPETFRPK